VYDPTLSVSPRLATGPVSARTVLTRGAVQKRCVYKNWEEFPRDGQCTNPNAVSLKGTVCNFHAVTVIPETHPNSAALKKVQAQTVLLVAEKNAKNKKYFEELDRDARDRKNQTDLKRKRQTGYNKTDEQRKRSKARHDLEAKEVEDRVRANHAKLVADMMVEYPDDWQQRIEAILTVEEVKAKVKIICATPMSQLTSLCPQQLNEEVLATIPETVDDVLNNPKVMIYAGICGPDVTRTCRAPGGSRIRGIRGRKGGKEVSHLRRNCSGAVRQSDCVDGRCSSRKRGTQTSSSAGSTARELS
jgi:hypothetical protein